ncbi:CU044_2847 family protein [Candidatus Thiosymbion oneisti]|uniref:CU044_2847 family protein n=1 Tax=Candidatus Thiosymbion oneisti TaxID=589554 RepID=UPI00114D0118|nr:CU044_2847 family protein [Candidatus Thiosymbion oneisti]
MATELIELRDGLFVEVQANPEDQPRQIVAGAASRVDGALDAVRGLLLKSVEPVASVWADMSRDLTIDQVEIELGLGFEATGKLFIAQGTGKSNVSFKLTVRPKRQD